MPSCMTRGQACAWVSRTYTNSGKALWCHNEHCIDLALVVEHGRVVDEHEAFARAHLCKQRRLRMLPKALQIRRLMHKRLVLERIPLQKIIHDFLPFFEKGY